VRRLHPTLASGQGGRQAPNAAPCDSVNDGIRRRFRAHVTQFYTVPIFTLSNDPRCASVQLRVGCDLTRVRAARGPEHDVLKGRASMGDAHPSLVDHRRIGLPSDGGGRRQRVANVARPLNARLAQLRLSGRGYRPLAPPDLRLRLSLPSLGRRANSCVRWPKPFRTAPRSVWAASSTTLPRRCTAAIASTSTRCNSSGERSAANVAAARPHRLLAHQA
jgi:hypothetical protein